MRIYVGVTDRDWYAFLHARSGVDEVNFWQPSGGRRFGALTPGDLFLFKLHYPANVIVGGGTFVSFDSFPAWLVWDAFLEKNGAPSYEEMCRRIKRYRGDTMSLAGAEPVGCIILTNPFFFDERDAIAAPADWSKNIVQGKTYRDDSPEGARMLMQVAARRSGFGVAEGPPAANNSDLRMFSEPVLGRRRLGQGAFRLLVVDAYGRRCAVSGEKALPVLQSAHIRPVARGGQHRIDNGLLLRSDIHTLFDRGYVTITPAGQFMASRRLKADYDNGEPYYALEGRPVALPAEVADQPASAFLEWHNSEVYLG